MKKLKTASIPATEGCRSIFSTAEIDCLNKEKAVPSLLQQYLTSSLRYDSYKFSSTRMFFSVHFPCKFIYNMVPVTSQYKSNKLSYCLILCIFIYVDAVVSTVLNHARRLSCYYCKEGSYRSTGKKQSNLSI